MNARGARTDARLLDTARRIIERDGYGALTVTSVAAEAGVTRRAVYLHFESRGALLAALFDHVAETEDLASSLARVWAAPDSTTALRSWARHLADYHVRLLPLSRAIAHAASHDEAAAAHMRTVARAQRRGCRRLVAGLQAEDNLAAPWTFDTAVDMLWALIANDLIGGLTERRRWSRQKLGAHLGELFVRTFTVHGGPPPVGLVPGLPSGCGDGAERERGAIDEVGGDVPGAGGVVHRPEVEAGR